MLVSDHGFGRYEKNFYLNRVLEDAGCCSASAVPRGRAGGLSTRA